jgi:hypothetical protein
MRSFSIWCMLEGDFVVGLSVRFAGEIGDVAVEKQTGADGRLN